jgi:hypothetical protein
MVISRWNRTKAGLLVVLFAAILLPRELFHECVDHGDHALQGATGAQVKAACSLCDIALPTQHMVGTLGVSPMPEGPSTKLVSVTKDRVVAPVGSTWERGPPRMA